MSKFIVHQDNDVKATVDADIFFDDGNTIIFKKTTIFTLPKKEVKKIVQLVHENKEKEHYDTVYERKAYP